MSPTPTPAPHAPSSPPPPTSPPVEEATPVHVTGRLDVGAIRARCEAATPGPWARDMYEDGDSGEGPYGVYPGARGPMVEGNDVVALPFDEEGYANDVAHCFCGPDAAFIVAAREDVPALLAEVERLREDHAETHMEAYGKGQECGLTDERRRLREWIRPLRVSRPQSEHARGFNDALGWVLSLIEDGAGRPPTAKRSIDDMTTEEIEAELRSEGVDVEAFLARVREAVAKAKSGGPS